MDKKKAKQKRRDSVTPEELIARAQRARWRFRAVARFAIQNLYWLADVEDQELGEDIHKNILLLTRKKDRTSLLSLQDKAILNKRAEDRTEIEKKHLSRIIGGLKCFRRYPTHVKGQLAGVTYFFYFGPGRTVVRQGDYAHSLYFVITGEVTVSQQAFDPILNEMVKQDIAVMGPGSMFGEVSLLHEIPRTATITTNTHVELLCLKKNDFDVILKATVKQQWQQIRDAMATFTYFDDWDEIAIRECCILSQMKAYPPEQTVLGDGVGLCDFVYFILKGKCRVIEHLLVTSEIRSGKKRYKLYVPTPVIEVHTPPSTTKFQDKEDEKKSKISIHKSNASSKAKLESKTQVMVDDATTDKETEDLRKTSEELGVKPEDASQHKMESKKAEKSKHSSLEMKKINNNRESSSDASFRTSEKKRSVTIAARTPTVINLSTKPAPRLSDCNLPPYVETHFMQVCYLNSTACFGIGENMKHRRIVTTVYTECLLIPRYWIMQRNKGNIWNRVQQFLNNHIPTTQQVFKQFITQRKWMAHRRRMVNEILSKQKLINDNNSTNVPYFIRINEEIDLD